MSEPIGVIWDVDGTLVDTAELHFNAWVQLAGEIAKPFTRADFAATFGRRNPEIVRQLFGDDLDDAAVADLGHRKETHYRTSVVAAGTALLPGVERLLKEFAAAGWPQAVGSSAPRANLDLLLKATGVAGYFAAVVAQEDTTRGKPDPQVFLAAAGKLGFDPRRCVVFEDAVAGVEAAKAGGMRCVAVRSAGHHPAEALAAAGADLVVETLEAVTAEDVRRLFPG